MAAHPGPAREGSPTGHRPAPETGLSARAFYRHFAGKDELLLVLMQDEYARSGARVRTAVARADGAARKVGAWIDEIVQAAGDPRRAARARLFTSQPAVLRRFPDEVSAAARLVLEPLAAAIREGRSTWELPSGDPDHDPELIHQLAGAAMARALARGRDQSVAKVAADVTDFALRALGGSNASS